MLDAIRILVVEEQFLIALDTQGILESAGGNQIVFARSSAEALVLGDRLSEFDLFVIDLPNADQNAVFLVRTLMDRGKAVVVTIGAPSALDGFPASSSLASVMKPFGQDELLGGCRKALGL